MTESVRVLLVEDLPTDAELAEREIRKTLQSCVFRWVETRPDYLAALEEFQPDLIVSDYRMPQFDGLTALKLALERTPFTPVIILTGAINEDTAVECMKAGAADYVIKEHIKRLGQAVTHALEQKRLRLERRQAETALREGEERYRTLVRTLPDAITVTDAAGNITYVPPATVHFYGYEAEDEVLGRSILEWVHVDYHEKALGHMENVLAGGFITSQEYLLLKKDGSLFFGEVSASCLKDAQDQAIGLIIIVRDISERKQAEEQLLYQANLLQNVSDAIIATDLSFKITSWNRAAEALYGWSASEVIGQPVDEILQSEYFDHQPEQVYQQLLERGIWKGEVIQKHKDSTRINILASVSLIKDSTGKPVGAVAVNRDITKRKRAEEAQAKLEEQLRQAQKLESIGRLAGGIAHDFNNLLVPIIGYAELGQMELSPDSQLYTDLNKIKTAAERAANLTKQILAFSRRQVLEVQVFNLNEVIIEFQEMLRRLITEDIEVQIFLTPTPCLLQADRTQIEQLLLNLSVNASDAMPNGGKLIIETDNVYLDEAYAQTHPETQPGNYVMLSLSDTGQGMDTETQKHIFEPFFTTKEQGKGTGLGLAMVFGIVKQHQGNIWVYSEPGHGTTFRIYLPRAEETTQLAVTTIPDSTSVYGTETVLVVEDEPMVRKLACETLETYGYIVIEAESPNKGLQFAFAYEGVIHLLLTDVIMPDMNGRELYEKLAVARPDLKVLYVSGYTDNVIVHHGVLDEGVNFLQKPFTVKSLTQKVRRVLD